MGAELEDTATDVEDAGREVLATTPEEEDAATLVDPGVLLPEDARLEERGEDVPLPAVEVDCVVLEEPEPDPIADDVWPTLPLEAPPDAVPGSLPHWEAVHFPPLHSKPSPQSCAVSQSLLHTSTPSSPPPVQLDSAATTTNADPPSHAFKRIVAPWP